MIYEFTLSYANKLEQFKTWFPLELTPPSPPAVSEFLLSPPSNGQHHIHHLPSPSTAPIFLVAAQEFFSLPSFSFFWFFLGPNLRHMEVPRLGVQLELQLPAYTTARATQDPSHVFDPHHSSWQPRILNPLNKARDRTCNLMVPSRIHFCCATMGTPGADINRISSMGGCTLCLSVVCIKP